MSEPIRQPRLTKEQQLAEIQRGIEECKPPTTGETLLGLLRKEGEDRNLVDEHLREKRDHARGPRYREALEEIANLDPRKVFVYVPLETPTTRLMRQLAREALSDE